MPKRVVGLDISSRRLLAVELENPRSKRPSLIKAAAVDLAEGAARDSEVIDIASVAAALRELWAKGKFSSKRVVLGVGNQRVLVRDHTVPQMSGQHLSQSLQYQVADLLPVPVSETILDFYPIEEVPESSPSQMRGLLVAALKESVETNVATLEDAGLKVIGVDLSSFAMIRALSRGGSLSGTHTVVMFAPRTTHIVVVKDGVPQFVRLVPVGGENITDALVDATGAERAEAEQLKHSIGLLHGNDPRFAAASGTILESLGSLLNPIRSTNNYYLTNYGGDPVEGIVLLGADSHLPGFADAISEALRIPAVLGDPFAGVQLRGAAKRQSLDSIAGDLAVPIGLALGRR